MNSCAGGCPEDGQKCEETGWWEQVIKAEENGEAPEEPTVEHIQQQIDHMLTYKLDEKDQLIEGIFGKSFSSEGKYFPIKDAARKLKYPIPTLEEICQIRGIEPVYDCKTGAEWQATSPDVQVLEPKGWPKPYMTSWFEERIPWGEYCLRRHHSTCDYRDFLTNRHERLEQRKARLEAEKTE